jgi:hypothetical protein
MLAEGVALVVLVEEPSRLQDRRNAIHKELELAMKGLEHDKTIHCFAMASARCAAKVLPSSEAPAWKITG